MLRVLSLLLVATLLACAPLAAAPPGLPYREAGLDQRQAAAHLLERLTYGPRPGEVDRIMRMGLETWLTRQLDGAEASPRLQAALQPLDTLGMSVEEIERTFLPPALVARMAEEAGVVKRDQKQDDPEYRRKIQEFMKGQGLRPLRELNQQLVAQKLLRGAYSENGLHEVLADFWFNHFNVSLTDNQSRQFVLSYERDAIRPLILGDFRKLLGATASHPAMLLYLDNATSSAAKGAETTMDMEMEELAGRNPGAARKVEQARRQQQQQQRGRQRGVNENYARELMELHTLGVDGGYTQKDVEEVARAFTGWTVMPIRPQQRAQLEKRMTQAKSVGFQRRGEFLFRADFHDAAAKRILGKGFPAGGGLEEGERVLDMLALHPSTAKHLARKLATRFVSDDPPQALVDRLAAKYLKSKGNLRAVMTELVYSPEFWRSRGQKIKAPHELAASAIRATNAEVRPTKALYDWISRMGEPLYAYQAPTGFPDRGDFWINSGALLNRMNFALNLAANRVEGVRVDLKALNGGREPGSPEEALKVYARLLLPERDVDGLVRQLLPQVQDPGYADRVAAKAEAQASGPVDPLAQVVGVLLGSPEFQRQ